MTALEQLAREMGITVEHGVIRHQSQIIQAFAKIVREAALEEAAKRLEKNGWLLQAADVIRALKGEPT